MKLIADRFSVIRGMGPFLAVTWPFIIFWQLLIPSQISKQIGNDFSYWYYHYKVYLLAHLSEFHLPLWSPAEATGYLFYSSPLAQSFYFLNIPYAVYYRLNHGISILSYQIFTISGISIFSLGLFLWLKTLKINLRAILFATLIIPISFKLIETARFPNAVHAAAWYPWILFAVTRLFRATSRRSAILIGFELIFYLINVVTAGYPYFAYYLIFLIPPYLFLLTVRRFRNQILNLTGEPNFRRIFATLMSSGLLAGMILSPLLISMRNLLVQTSNRAGASIDWARDIWASTLVDIFGSFVFPPSAKSEGWIYFGMMGFLIIIFFFVKGLFEHPNTDPNVFSRGLTIYFGAWILFVVYIGWDGNVSPLNFFWNFLWRYLPGFSMLRVWARIHVILLPIIGLLLAMAFQYFLSFLEKINDAKVAAKPIVIFMGWFLTILIYQIFMWKNRFFSSYWEWIAGDKIPPGIFIFSGIAAFLILMGSMLFARYSNLPHDQKRNIIYLIIMAFGILDARGGQISPWIWISDAEESELTAVDHINTGTMPRESFDQPRVDLEMTIPLDGSFNIWTDRTSWYFDRYSEFLNRTDAEVEYRNDLLGLQDGHKIFFTRRLDYQKIQDYLEDAKGMSQYFDWDLAMYTGDQLILDVSADRDGYISFIDNWEPGWHATVDGEDVDLELLFGTFKSLAIHRGDHRIAFYYKPYFGFVDRE